MDIDFVSFLAAILTMAAPLVIASLGETISEKAGVINLSLDGSLLLSAMIGFAAASESQSIAVGFFCAALTGAIAAVIIGMIGVKLNQSQVAVGFTLTFLCRDLAYFLGNPYARQAGPQLEVLPIPTLSNLPVLGNLLFHHSPVVYLSLLLIPTITWLLYRTKFGLLLRMAGENQEGCWARGYNPQTIRIIAASSGGILVGIAGAAYSLSVKPGWGHPQGCEGIGWIALALVIFGSWHPIRVIIGAYFFGLLQLLGIYFQDFFPTIPSQIFQVAPFPLMIFTLTLVHFGGRIENQKKVSAFIRMFSGKPPKQMGIGYNRQ